MKNICVFTGSSPGNRPSYMDAASGLGIALAARGLGTVYGGATIGLMGAVANGALGSGGEVYGVMPHALANLEIAHKGLTKLHIVSTMHERKALMADMSDGFIALPGGLGTLDELFEIWTWAQLGEHQKPVAMMNIEGFFDPLLSYLDHVNAEGFIKPAHRDMLIVGNSATDALDKMEAFVPKVVSKLISENDL